LILGASNTDVLANGSCSLSLLSGTNNEANAPKLRCYNYNTIKYCSAELVVDSGRDLSGILFGCKLEAVQTEENNLTWGYSNGNNKSSVYYVEDNGGELRMDITASGISFKAGSSTGLGPGERMLITASEIATFVNIGTAAGTGVKDRSFEHLTTSGTTTLTTADAFRTTINTPSASGRTFVLPATTSNVGYWYGFCNKSTTHTIGICFPDTLTTIFTIPVASNAGGGSFAKFAVNSNGTGYFTSG